tara:strand:+ start:176 stop:694 length:519 start_codon:yes stop_codon:yes gene_type:complete
MAIGKIVIKAAKAAIARRAKLAKEKTVKLAKEKAAKLAKEKAVKKAVDSAAKAKAYSPPKGKAVSFQQIGTQQRGSIGRQKVGQNARTEAKEMGLLETAIKDGKAADVSVSSLETRLAAIRKTQADAPVKASNKAQQRVRDRKIGKAKALDMPFITDKSTKRGPAFKRTGSK